MATTRVAATTATIRAGSWRDRTLYHKRPTKDPRGASDEGAPLVFIKNLRIGEFMIDMKVDDLIAMLEPYRGKEVYIKCAYHNLDIKEVKVERYSHAGDYTHKVYERVQIVPDSGDMFDIFYDD